MLRWGRVEVSGGFLLVLALLYYMDDQGLLFPALAACALHELGHLAAIYLLGGRVVRLSLSCVGAEMRLSDRQAMGHGGEVLAALAGPAAGLLAAWPMARMGTDWGWCCAGLSVVLSLFNLLPVSRLDGGRALGHLLALAGLEGAERAIAVLSAASAAGLLLVGGLLFIQGRGNLTLLLTAAWLALPDKKP